MATSRWKLAASRRRCAWTLPALSLPEKRQSARLTLILSARVHVVALLAFLAGILGIVAIADGLAVGRAIVAVLLLARLLLLVFYPCLCRLAPCRRPWYPTAGASADARAAAGTEGEGSREVPQCLSLVAASFQAIAKASAKPIVGVAICLYANFSDRPLVG